MLYLSALNPPPLPPLGYFGRMGGYDFAVSLQ